MDGWMLELKQRQQTLKMEFESSVKLFSKWLMT
jgi:hypothetical protein